jgi:hypothetical protein
MGILCKVKEIKNLYKHDYRGMITTSEYRPVGFFGEPPEIDYLKEDKQDCPENDDLSPDHLTALYWG